jgi:hypothetical protein
MAKRRPSYLILVSSSKGIEIFSAHHTEADAVAMHDRLGAMLSKNAGSAVHLLKVPDVDGLVPPDQALCRKIESTVPAVKPAPAPKIQRPVTDEEFDEQTRQMLKSGGPRDGFRDDSYQGAFS